VCVFSPDLQRVFAAGKLKHRDKYSGDDDDLAIAAGPIKVFDILSGNVVETLKGPKEEVTDMKLVEFRGEPFLICGSQDGYIWKYALNQDYRCECSWIVW